MADIKNPERVQWVKVKLLETGSTSNVYLVTRSSDAMTAVLKVAAGLFDSDILINNKMLRNEYNILIQLQHPGIVEVDGLICVEDSMAISGAYEEIPDNGRLYPVQRLAIIMKWYSGGCCQRFLERSGKYHLTESETATLLRPIAEGLLYLKNQNIVHRDVKLENFFVDESGRTYLGDFGFARSSSQEMSDISGTVIAMAPEVINECKFSSASDVWALGVSIYGCLIGYRPFGEGNLQSDIPVITDRIRFVKYSMPKNKLSQNAQDLIRSIFVADPAERITIEQILIHPFFDRHREFTIAPKFEEPVQKKIKSTN